MAPLIAALGTVILGGFWFTARERRIADEVRRAEHREWLDRNADFVGRCHREIGTALVDAGISSYQPIKPLLKHYQLIPDDLLRGDIERRPDPDSWERLSGSSSRVFFNQPLDWTRDYARDKWRSLDSFGDNPTESTEQDCTDMSQALGEQVLAAARGAVDNLARDSRSIWNLAGELTSLGIHEPFLLRDPALKLLTAVERLDDVLDDRPATDDEFVSRVRDTVKQCMDALAASDGIRKGLWEHEAAIARDEAIRGGGGAEDPHSALLAAIARFTEGAGAWHKEFNKAEWEMWKENVQRYPDGPPNRRRPRSGPGAATSQSE